jgi:hypothetical protein
MTFRWAECSSWPFPLTGLGSNWLSSGFNRVNHVFSVLPHRPLSAGSIRPPEDHA